MSLAFIATETSVTIILNGKHYVIGNTHLNYKAILKAIKDNDLQKLETLIDIPATVKQTSGGRVEVVGDNVYLDGEIVHNVVAQRLVEHVKKGIPVDHLMRFIERLYANPSKNSVDQLYNFLEHVGLPITTDGHVLGYKGIRSNFYDKHSGKILNSVGSVIEMPRNKVADDPNNGCSYGLHIGTLDYARSWGDIVVLVKFDPADCVSVPNDSNHQKLRVCKYEVLSVYDGDKVLSGAVYNDDMESLDNEDEEYFDDWADSWDDDDDVYDEVSRDESGRFVSGNKVCYTQQRDSNGRFMRKT